MFRSRLFRWFLKWQCIIKYKQDQPFSYWGEQSCRKGPRIPGRGGGAGKKGAPKSDWVPLLLHIEQGCGVVVGVEDSESERFSTWGVGVGVADNFNDSDSDSGQTFCSPIVTVCATNVRRRHTWFKQLDASARDDHGYSDRRQRTNLHTFTQGPFEISSVPWAHHGTYTLWMQPFGACITEISICSFWLALSLLRDVGEARWLSDRER